MCAKAGGIAGHASSDRIAAKKWVMRLIGLSPSGRLCPAAFRREAYGPAVLRQGRGREVLGGVGAE
ncbi:hypothetical protein BEL01nite_52240 [Bradyrhizobium elkanii]|nr:hypothetical protein BEL01nite_52240 [Bradyrhizobium elkanii]